MLKDYLIDWCQEESNNSHAGNCGHHCDNKNFCTHNCDDCLDQVHWYPSSDGRADYTCHNLLLRYVLRLIHMVRMLKPTSRVNKTQSFLPLKNCLTPLVLNG